jgi:hypothetical protein
MKIDHFFSELGWRHVSKIIFPFLTACFYAPALRPTGHDGAMAYFDHVRLTENQISGNLAL